MNPGGVLFVGVEGESLGSVERVLLKRIRPGGVVLFARNVGTAAGLRALVGELRTLVPGIVVAVDAEGGRVDRLKGLFGPAPAGAEMARQAPAFARRAGRWVGAALAWCDIDLDFAPVLDLDRGGTGNALDGRCLGNTPRAVAARAAAFIEGLESSGSTACPKHFPGLGGARFDTHLGKARIDLERQALTRDLEPFRRLLPLSVATMTCHAVYPGWGDPERPASLSPTIASTLLRRELRYRGALLSDDLEMGALEETGELAARAAASLAAGCDGLLFCRRLEEMPAVVARLRRADSRERVAQASGRLEHLRRRISARRRSAPAAPPIEKIRARLDLLRD